MATIQEVKQQIENANALGRQNLTDKGVDVSADATTYEIMQSIADVSGGGTSYTSIVFNEDRTVILTDVDGIEHTMVCDYDVDKLVAIIYDGTEIPLTYDGDDLTKIGNTEVSFVFTRNEITATKKGTFLCTAMGTKVNEGLCICGWYYSNGLYYGRVFGKTMDDIATDKTPTYSGGTFEYNGETWYFNQYQNSQSTFKDGLMPIYLNVAVNSFSKALFDYYFMVE